MATVHLTKPTWGNGYPTTDGRPMAETDLHRILMIALIQTLDWFYAANPLVYVSGNLLVFYQRGNKRRHLAPDVFVVKGVPKRRRDNYLVWEERGIRLVIELTSSSTRHADTVRKFRIYQDVLRVSEYFLFDPRADYLEPRLTGYRLRRGLYVPIQPVDGRLPSRELGLHLEQNGQELRLYNPATGAWLPTPEERVVQAEETVVQTQAALDAAESARQQVEAEAQRLRRELEALRRRSTRES